MRLLVLILLIICCCISCRQKPTHTPVSAADYMCKTMPAFVSKTGLATERIAFTTSELNRMGIWLKEMPLRAGDTPKLYQHPSWKSAGWLAPIQIDGNGNVFTAPAPFVNVLNNPVKDQNTIYKISNEGGIMQEFARLPWPVAPNDRNPFGITSLAYNCKNKILYISTVAGSTAQKENGCLYAMDAISKQIIGTLCGHDYFGIQLVVEAEKLVLLAGSARTSDFFSIPVNDQGTFSGEPKLAGTISGLGMRGDEKVKKITMKSADNIVIKALPFDFNLIAPTEKQESAYEFYFDNETAKWLPK